MHIQAGPTCRVVRRGLGVQLAAFPGGCCLGDLIQVARDIAQIANTGMFASHRPLASVFETSATRDTPVARIARLSRRSDSAAGIAGPCAMRDLIQAAKYQAPTAISGLCTSHHLVLQPQREI